jgi:hypothetical protein
MADTPSPDWKKDFPNLDDVINPEDVEKKGSFATYVNWCKTSQLLRLHAPGWQFELRTSVDPEGLETHVFKAPNGTGYLVGFFRAPTGSGFKDTPDFPQAVMCNKNNPVPWDRITARDVTDTHRRAMCTTAAAHFGLAWQLWAKVEIENPFRPDGSTQAPPKPSAKPSANPPAQSNADTSNAAGELQDLRGTVSAAMQAVYAEKPAIAVDWVKALKGQFPKLGADKPQIKALNKDQLVFTQEFIYSYK